MDPYTILVPLQQVTSTPYSIRSTVAANADNATMLGGLPATGFLQNGTSQQASTNYNISGNGTLGGTLSANLVNAGTQYNLGGSRVLSIAGSNNIFAGVGAGAANTTGVNNSFFGALAGTNNSTGINNSLFGSQAGGSNTTGAANSFFGSSAGFSNTIGEANSFFGSGSGSANTTGNDNSLFGAQAGIGNTTGGYQSNGVAGITNAAAIGAHAVVAQSNSLVLGASTVSVGIGTTAPRSKLHVEGNIFVGAPGPGIILKSPDGAVCGQLSIGNDGKLITTPIACP